MTSLRDPDGFGMYTYNDHFGYGVLEVAQNLVLDFDEAATWKEKWSICEGAALFFAKGDADPLFQCVTLHIIPAVGANFMQGR